MILQDLQQQKKFKKFFYINVKTYNNEKLVK